MLRLEADKMQGAIQRAKSEHLKVRIISVDERKYAVESGKNTYTVRFVVVNGLKLAECDCPARVVCKHISAAAQANVMAQSMRQQAPTADESRNFLARNVGWSL